MLFSRIVLTLFLIVSVASPCYPKVTEYLVTKVLDGDTVVLENGDVVHYLGIEAPERGKKNGGPEFYAREAVKYNKQLVLLKKVRLEFDTVKKDEHGRILAYVFVKNLFVNGDLVRLGYARVAVQPPNVLYKSLLLKYQREAVGKDLGVWQEKREDTERYYVGNKKTYAFHKPSCPLVGKIPEKNRIIFRSRTDSNKDRLHAM